jgi:hypothetical protein
MVRANKLAIGDKLLITGATKEGADMPAPPLEAYSSVWLSLGVNGARTGASQADGMHAPKARATMPHDRTVALLTDVFFRSGVLSAFPLILLQGRGVRRGTRGWAVCGARR